MNPIHHIKGIGKRRTRRGSRGRGRGRNKAAPAPAAPRERVFAFIDSQNIHRGIREQGWDMDWRKFRAYLAETLGVSRALLFIGRVDGNEELYEELSRAGFELVFKETVAFRKDGEETVKGNVDTDLVLHAMIEHPHYDKAVIATGDGDFHSLVKHLHGQGKLGKLVIPHARKTSKLLKEFSEHLEPMDALRKTLEADKPQAAPEPATPQKAPRPARKPAVAKVKPTRTPREKQPRQKKQASAQPKLHPVWW